jgi:membrane fusion protein (multidrug efflux system)
MGASSWRWRENRVREEIYKQQSKNMKAQEKAAAAQVEIASAQVQNAELQLSYTTVYAPIDGRVAQKTFETGQRVQSGQTGLSISEPDDWVVADNATGNFAKIVQRVPVKIVFDRVSIRGYEQLIVPGLSVDPKIRVKPNA